MPKEVMEMMNQHLHEAKKLKKIQEKKKAEFYDEIRGSNRYDEDEDEDVGDEVEAELLQAMRESRKTTYTDELRRRSVSGFPSSR